MSHSTRHIILGIDTSCDDTSIAVVNGTKVLSNVVSSQDALHREWGGVVPMIAQRAHNERFETVLNQALQRAHVTRDQLQEIAVTVGPGLAPALEVGVARAQALAHELNIPLRPVFHMEAHLLAVFAQSASGQSGTPVEPTLFPALGVIVSGGHTELVYTPAIGQYQLIGETVDDAMGEAFDKVARLLGLGYPGGALLAELAQTGDASRYALPTAMRQSGNLNVSYSGLKTACVRLFQELTQDGKQVLSKQEVADFAASFQRAAIQTLVYKTLKALEQFPAKSIWLGGGVAANTALRKELRSLAQQNEIPFLTPYSRKLCRDNGAMVAVAAALNPAPAVESIDRQPRLAWQASSKTTPGN